MNDTKRIISKMLKTSTGAHFLDSGGAYGRHWERNQRRKFNKEPEVALEISVYKGNDSNGKAYESVELSPVINVYHFLSEAVEYAPKLDKELHAFLRRREFEGTGYLGIAEKFAERKGWKCSTFNSYNGDDYLSQVIQGVITGDNEGLVLLQIHQGCDVRGGYTRPVAFRWSSDWQPCLWDHARASVYCDGGHGWTIEPGYSQGFNDEAPLDTFAAHVLNDGEKPEIGKLCARDTEAFCPLCAGRLSAGF